MAAPSIFSSALIVITYAWGGLLRHGESYGWAFFQPGKGGQQFVTLQAATWFCVGTSLVIPWLPWLFSEIIEFNYRPKRLPTHSSGLLLVSSGLGLIGQILTVISLFAFQRPMQRFKWRFILSERAEGKAYLYFFMSIQTGLAVYAMIVLFFSDRFEDLIVGTAATLMFVSLIAVSTSVTHGVGGPWLKGNEGFTAFQPGRGGIRFVILQFIGWSTMSTCILVGVSRSLSLWTSNPHPFLVFFANQLVPGGATGLGVLGLFSQIILTLSLFIFEDEELAKATNYYKYKRYNEKSAWLSCLTGLPPEVKRHIYEYL